MDFSIDKSFDLSSLTLLCCCSKNVDRVAIYCFLCLRKRNIGNYHFTDFWIILDDFIYQWCINYVQDIFFIWNIRMIQIKLNVKMHILLCTHCHTYALFLATLVDNWKGLISNIEAYASSTFWEAITNDISMDFDVNVPPKIIPNCLAWWMSMCGSTIYGDIKLLIMC